MKRPGSSPPSASKEQLSGSGPPLEAAQEGQASSPEHSGLTSVLLGQAELRRHTGLTSWERDGTARPGKEDGGMAAEGGVVRDHGIDLEGGGRQDDKGASFANSPLAASSLGEVFPLMPDVRLVCA